MTCPDKSELTSNMQISGPRVGSAQGPCVWLRPGDQVAGTRYVDRGELCINHCSGGLEIFPVSQAQLLNLARQALDIACQMGLLNDKG